MKTMISISIDTEVALRVKDLKINVSKSCNDLLRNLCDLPQNRSDALEELRKEVMVDEATLQTKKKNIKDLESKRLKELEKKKKEEGIQVL